MRLSELKELNPKAYEVFLEEMKKQNKQAWVDTFLTKDAPLSECVYFGSSKPSKEIWQQIYFEKDFTLFNEWHRKEID